MLRVLVITAVLAVATSLPLPSYVKKCNLRDPRLNDCSLKVARWLLSSSKNGDWKYVLPDLNPLKVVQVTAFQGRDLNITLDDVKVRGLMDARISDVKINGRTLDTDVHVEIPSVEITGKYKVEGKVLTRPIKGNGDASATLNKLDFVYRMKLFKAKKDDGIEYLWISDSKLNFKPFYGYIHLDNLFNGDKARGEDMNKFLNDNWQNVFKALEDPLRDAVSDAITGFLSRVLSHIPSEELFEK